MDVTSLNQNQKQSKLGKIVKINVTNVIYVGVNWRMISHILYGLMLIILIVDVSKLIKDFNLMSGLYVFLSKHIKHKRLLLSILSSMFGILPIHGRNILSSPILKSFVTCDDKSKNRIGMINYLTTHHYYLWSPIEKTILIPVLALPITYLQMLKYTLPILLIMLSFILVYVFTVVKEKDITFEPIKVDKNERRSKWYQYINWKLIGLLVVVMTLNWIVKSHSEYLTSIITSATALPTATVIAFIIAFLLGSSAKFAGIVVILTGIFGIEYLTFFIAVEFSAYLLSPMHKCIVITNEYFDTHYLYFYKITGILTALIILTGILSLIY